MKKYASLIIILLISFSLYNCSRKDVNNVKESINKENNKLLINSAAGLKPVLDRINEKFSQRHGTKIMAQYMCSAMVLSNLLLSRETDIFFPGDEFFMNIAVEKGAVKRENVFHGGYMIPAITTSKGNPKNIKTLEDLAKPGVKVGLGDFKTLAVGRLSEKLLKEEGLLEKVLANHVFNGPSATKLQLNVALGSVDAAINWKPTILMHSEMSECIDIPFDRLKYSIAPCAISTFSKNKEIAQMYVDFLKSPEARRMFDEWGYSLPKGAENCEKVD